MFSFRFQLVGVRGEGIGRSAGRGVEPVRLTHLKANFGPLKPVSLGFKV